MRRVVITGLGIYSSIGNSQQEVTEALKNMKSGIRRNQAYQEAGMRSLIDGPIEVDIENLIDRKIRRFMGPGSAYAYLAMRDAIADSGLSSEVVSNERSGLIVGSGGPSVLNQIEAVDILRSKGVKRVGPYMVPRCMSSTASATLATPFQIKGINYSITSACATSAHCIGNATEMIQMNKQDVMFAGGSEEVFWGLSMLFDAMGALSTKYNDNPETASRPFDVDRDGFVISGGAGMLVLEEYEHARRRGAHIYAEVVGYGATSDGYDMVAPSGEGAQRCMKQALATVKQPIDYINAHGTSTPVGDLAEIRAVKGVFSSEIPWINSTKSLTGHSVGAAGVTEAIYSLLMMKHGFISGTKNLTTVDPQIGDVPIARETMDKQINTVMSNSFGFGGTNATLVFQRV